MAGSKWRMGIVLEAQLDTLSHRLVRDIGHHVEGKVDTRCDAARCDHIAIFDNAGFNMRSADLGAVVW